jgi:hypothetical protein
MESAASLVRCDANPLAQVTEAEILQDIADQKLAVTAGDQQAWVKVAALECAYSIYIRGDNTIANAKKAGALDVRELYPDMSPKLLEDFAKEFYGQGV